MDAQISFPQLIAFILSRLSELGSLNKYHEFEHLCRHFARLRICENILPATGPVSGGGDQGRDFETYHSYLISTPIVDSTFLGDAHGKMLVFACSIQKDDICTKIKSDLKKIFSGSVKPDAVYFFCVASVKISDRHELIEYAKNLHQTRLEILDGHALSEALATHEVFWIAQRYLDVPASMFPRIESSLKEYYFYKSYWLDQSHKPWSYADFFQIQYGIRVATAGLLCRRTPKTTL